MDELFSCRNCLHNAAQTLSIGSGVGFCLLHQSVIREPDITTCKYLSRKDMPSFIVSEGVQEHAYEFATFSAIVNMETMKSVPRISYSEKHAWLTGSFDPLTMSLAHARKITPTHVFIEALAGGVDGKRSLAHASVVRRYMANCGTWRSSYRLVLALAQEIGEPVYFSKKELSRTDVHIEDAIWDLFFVRISGIQEYGFHAGLEELIWATDSLNGSLSEFDWERLQVELQKISAGWIDLILLHAQKEGAFFPDTPPAEEGADQDSI